MTTTSLRRVIRAGCGSSCWPTAGPAGPRWPAPLRGLGNASVAIRVKPQVKARHPRFTGKLVDYPIKKGMWRVLRAARFRATGPVDLNAVIAAVLVATITAAQKWG